MIFDGFDYERWKKAYLKSHSKQVAITKRLHKIKIYLSTYMQPPPEKQALVSDLVQFLDGNIWKWCIDANLNELWQDHPRQFLEMKAWLFVTIQQ